MRLCTFFGAKMRLEQQYFDTQLGRRCPVSLKLTKNQLDKRKRRRLVTKPVRHAWRIYLKQLVQEYNHVLR